MQSTKTKEANGGKVAVEAVPETKAEVQPQVESTEVVPVSAAVPTTTDRVGAVQFAEDAGAGLDNLGAGDFAVPFLSILQKGSPQVDETSTKGKFIDGARQGMLLNTVTMKLYDGKKGVVVIPCAYNKLAVEWKPDRGGLVGHHGISDQIVMKATRNEKNQLVLPNSNLLIETAYHYVLLVEDDGTVIPAVVSMASTQLKKSRRWNTTQDSIRMEGPNGSKFKPPSFSHMYKITTVPEANDSGSWFGFVIENVGMVTDSYVYSEAKNFNKAVLKGLVKVSAPPLDPDDVQAKTSDEVPF